MKKALLSLTLVLVGSFSALAQQESPSLNRKTGLVARVMAVHLELSEVQAVQVDVIIKEYFQKADLIAATYPAETEVHKRKRSELDKSFERKLLSILSSDQTATYREWKANSQGQVTWQQ